MSDHLWHAIERNISDHDVPFQIESKRSVGGGSINRALHLEGQGRSYFAKLNNIAHADMFAAEMDGLEELASASEVRIPAPVCHGISGDVAYLVCEWLNLRSASSDTAEMLGRRLAAQHRHLHKSHGWHRDNTIGSTVQVNTVEQDWCAFWRSHRLGFQLQLAAANGFTGSLQARGERLMGDMDQLLVGHEPQPSLLHGDLWAGNWGADTGGAPVLFDPAVYYGDREADLAMTELFGGFPEVFYAAYREAWPLDAGYPVRKTLYNLYHILNHANLFGGGYASQAETMMNRLLAELG